MSTKIPVRLIHSFAILTSTLQNKMKLFLVLSILGNLMQVISSLNLNFGVTRLVHPAIGWSQPPPPSPTSPSDQLCMGIPSDPAYTAIWSKENQPPGGWYKNIGSSSVYRHYARLLGADPNPYGPNPMCLRLLLDHYEPGKSFWTLTATINAVAKDFSYAKAVVNGKIGDYDPLGGGLGQPGHGVNVYVVKADLDKKYYIYVSCFPNGELGWAINSFHPSISERTRAEVLDWVKDNMPTVVASDSSIVTHYDQQLCEPCT